MSLIKIISTGGTIVNTRQGLIPVQRLLEDIPGLSEIADFDVSEPVQIRSGSLRLGHWLEIAAAVAKAAADSRVDGIVVTHGTFTLEETAYFLHLTVRTEKPIVCVASQRMHDAVGNDGDRNMIDAVRAVAAPEARGKGVLVVLHEEIHSAREVVKTNQRPGGFVSLGRGLLGHIETDRASFYYSPSRRHTHQSEFAIGEIHALPHVDIIAGYVGADDTAAKACVGAGAQGLVLSGYAYSGRPSADQWDGLAQIAASGIPVVLCNRGGAGRVPVTLDDPFIQGDTLVPQKARVLLMLGLTKTKDVRELQRMFDEY